MPIDVQNTLYPGAILKGLSYQYRIVRVIGHGSFGITYIADIYDAAGNATGLIAAIKELFIDECNGREGESVTVNGNFNLFADYFRRFKREANLLSEIRHPNIVNVIECFDFNNTTYYSMTYIEGGNLNELIESRGKIPEKEALEYTSSLANALTHLHQRTMLHLDIKPGNIMMLCGKIPVLIDFGLAKHFSDDGRPEGTAIIGSGTPGYAPIEQMDYKGIGTIPYTIDIYALGATLFKMLTGQRPPDASDIYNNGFPEDELLMHGVSSATIRIIKTAMQPIWRNRYVDMTSFKEAIDAVIPGESPAQSVDSHFTANSVDAQNSGFVTIDGVMRTPYGSVYHNTTIQTGPSDSIADDVQEEMPAAGLDPNFFEKEIEQQQSRKRRNTIALISCCLAFAAIIFMVYVNFIDNHSAKRTIDDDEIEMVDSSAIIEKKEVTTDRKKSSSEKAQSFKNTKNYTPAKLGKKNSSVTADSSKWDSYVRAIKPEIKKHQKH